MNRNMAGQVSGTYEKSDINLEKFPEINDFFIYCILFMERILKAVRKVWHVGTHFAFLVSIYCENRGVQAVSFNFLKSSDIPDVVIMCNITGEKTMVPDRTLPPHARAEMCMQPIVFLNTLANRQLGSKGTIAMQNWLSLNCFSCEHEMMVKIKSSYLIM